MHSSRTVPRPRLASITWETRHHHPFERRPVEIAGSTFGQTRSRQAESECTLTGEVREGQRRLRPGQVPAWCVNCRVGSTRSLRSPETASESAARRRNKTRVRFVRRWARLGVGTRGTDCFELTGFVSGASGTPHATARTGPDVSGVRMRRRARRFELRVGGQRRVGGRLRRHASGQLVRDVALAQ